MNKNQKKLIFPLFVPFDNKIIIGRADAEDKWLKETYPETTSESENDFLDEKDDEVDDNDYEPIELIERHCSDNEFECISDHKCISLEKYCDYTIDCDDGSDENSCATTINAVPSETDINFTESNYVDGSGVTEGDGFYWRV